MDNDKYKIIEGSNGKSWINVESMQAMDKFMQMREWLHFQVMLFNVKHDEELEELAHAKFGIEYHKPEPVRLGYYIMTEPHGLMWRDGNKVYKIKSDYQPEKKAFKGKYQFVRNATGFDL